MSGNTYDNALNATGVALTAEMHGSRRPGGRTARTREAVMRAVVAELAGNGYTGTTVERVAQRAGIAKTTIYRRWGGMDGLLADLMAEHAAREIPVPDEGDLDRDLRALASAGGGRPSAPRLP